MGTPDQPEPDTRAVFHGACPFLIAAFGVAAGYTFLSLARVRDEADDLTILGGWAVYMTLTLGLAVASLWRGPRGGRWAAAAAIAVCVVSIGWVAVACAKVMWR